MDYVLNVYFKDEFICSLGGKNMNYDNVIWYELSDLIDSYKDKNITREFMVETISKISDYFNVLDNENAIENEPAIDFTNQTLDKPMFMIYEFDEVSSFECGFDLIKKDDAYFTKYDEEFVLPIISITGDEELLNKKKVSFDELMEIVNFVNDIYSEKTDYDKDFILNNNKVLVLNII